MTKAPVLNVILNIAIIVETLLTFNQSIGADVTPVLSDHELKNNLSNILTEFEITAPRIRIEGERRAVFEGPVSLRRDILTMFYANKVVIESSNGERIEHIQMLGNVSMTKLDIMIHSQEASSDDFIHYVDFTENVILLKEGSRSEPRKLRYYFITGEIVTY